MAGDAANAPPGGAPDAGWTWKQIETAILGGADMGQAWTGADIATFSDPNTLFHAADVFYRLAAEIDNALTTFNQQVNALVGPNGSWTGDGATAAADIFTFFSDAVGRQLKVINGNGDAAKAVYNQLDNTGNYLNWAINEIHNIDYYYAYYASAYGATTTNASDGTPFVHVSDIPGLPELMRTTMFGVIQPLTTAYNVTTTEVKPGTYNPPVLPPPKPPPPPNQPPLNINFGSPFNKMSAPPPPPKLPPPTKQPPPPNLPPPPKLPPPVMAPLQHNVQLPNPLNPGGPNGLGKFTTAGPGVLPPVKFNSLPGMLASPLGGLAGGLPGGLPGFGPGVFAGSPLGALGGLRSTNLPSGTNLLGTGSGFDAFGRPLTGTGFDAFGRPIGTGTGTAFDEFGRPIRAGTGTGFDPFGNPLGAEAAANRELGTLAAQEGRLGGQGGMPYPPPMGGGGGPRPDQDRDRPTWLQEDEAVWGADAAAAPAVLGRWDS